MKWGDWVYFQWDIENGPVFYGDVVSAYPTGLATGYNCTSCGITHGTFGECLTCRESKHVKRTRKKTHRHRHSRIRMLRDMAEGYIEDLLGYRNRSGRDDR